MTPYLVTYDLNKNKDYQTLYDELEKLNGHRTMLSVWLVPSSKNAMDFKKHLLSFMDDDDSVWVTEVTKNHAFSNAKNGTNAWLKKYPPQR
ncbi:CRISPR-associated endonuclease Cas2 [Agrobacterium rhizogenes]|uniref:CRISPR-associated endonuclease Cas2 n=1 Tax=Rhizobium rhizogenes TaxID=359 RepID=UPI0022B6BF24|nr:CRISPR-associated endonuclease Cas2 [Rhizobium rhizogenes]MCZ7451358.1 CRISPR-associated endonuclease Cas2 [Rhizobium rhizogenes]